MREKILICSNAYPPDFIGGAELIAHYQAKQLQTMGYDVIIFTGDIRNVGKRHSLRREDFEGLPVYRIHLIHEDYDSKYVNFSHTDIEEHFRNTLKKFSPEIVHFHNLIGLSVGLIHIAKRYGCKTILTLHDHWGLCFKNTIIKNNNELCQDFSQCSECMEAIPDANIRNIPMRMRRDFIAMQLEDVDAFISPSQYLADTYVLAGIPKEKMHVIWNGIDVGKFSCIKKISDPDHVRFTFIGYFGRHKGIHVLLEALEHLDNKEKIIINLIGAGELLPRYKDEMQDKNLSRIVTFWGRIRDIEDAYAKTDVFILPSIWPENQPVSITEAMAARIPVIASDVGGIPELVDDGKTGLLFKTGDARDLAGKIADLINNPGKIEILGNNAFEKIKMSTLENQIKKYVEIYEKVLSEPTPDRCERHAIVVCCGNIVDPDCSEALKYFTGTPDTNNYWFLMLEWLQKDQIKKAILFWVMDQSIDENAIDIAVKNNLSLLVPERSKVLTDFCRKSNSGLYYQNWIEIFSCLHYLMNHDNVRILMGKNGFEYFSKKYNKKWNNLFG